MKLRSVVMLASAVLSAAAVSMPARADSYYVVDLAIRIEQQADYAYSVARGERVWDSDDARALDDLRNLAYEAETFRRAIEAYPDRSYMVRSEYLELRSAIYDANSSIRYAHFSYTVSSSVDSAMRSFYDLERVFDAPDPYPPHPYPPGPDPYPPHPYPPGPDPYPPHPYPPGPGPGPYPPHPYPPGPGPGPHPGPFPPGPGPGPHPGPGPGPAPGPFPPRPPGPPGPRPPR